MGRVKKSQRIGSLRPLDGLGRICLPVEFRRLARVGTAAQVSVSLAVDPDGRVLGILVQPLEWITGAGAPSLKDAMDAMAGYPIREV